MLKQTLLAAGISESDIQVIPSEEEAIESALNQCEKGDLLIILGDDITRCWKQIVHFNAEEGDATTEDEPSHTYPEKLYEPIEHKFELAEGQRLVHDERGVRLIVEHDEESD